MKPRCCKAHEKKDKIEKGRKEYLEANDIKEEYEKWSGKEEELEKVNE